MTVASRGCVRATPTFRKLSFQAVEASSTALRKHTRRPAAWLDGAEAVSI